MRSRGRGTPATTPTASSTRPPSCAWRPPQASGSAPSCSACRPDLLLVVLEQGDQLLRRTGDVQRYDRHQPVGTAVVQLDGEIPGSPRGERAEARVVAVLPESDLDEPGVGEVGGELRE